MSEANVTISREGGGIVILTLSRPERRNSLSLSLITELLSRLDELDSDSSVRVVILASTGTVFSSGHDLKEMGGQKEDGHKNLFSGCVDLMLSLQRLSVPVIAEVQGPALAAGCQLVASCDLAIASDLATFSTPGVRIGLFCTTPMVPLSRTIGPKRALEMLYTGKAIDAITAEQWGLVNHVVSLDRLRSATLELARQLADLSPAAMKSGKQAFYAELSMSYSDAYEHARSRMVHDAMAPDAAEGIHAFLEKRSPCWVADRSNGQWCGQDTDNEQRAHSSEPIADVPPS